MDVTITWLVVCSGCVGGLVGLWYIPRLVARSWLRKGKRLGLLAKWAAVTGRPAPVELEGLRLHLCDDSGGQADTVVVAFAGGALQMGGLPAREFQRTLVGGGWATLFLADLTGMSWYQRDPDGGFGGEEYYRQRLLDTLRPYRIVVFIGNCMGATGALLFADLAHKVVVFTPHVDPTTHPQWMVRFGSKFLPMDIRSRLYSSLRRRLETCGTPVDIHVNVEGSPQADLLADIATVRVHRHDDCTGPVVRWLRDGGRLQELIRAAVEEAQTLRCSNH